MTCCRMSNAGETPPLHKHPEARIIAFTFGTWMSNPTIIGPELRHVANEWQALQESNDMQLQMLAK
jgi:hypothetical protein